MVRAHVHIHRADATRRHETLPTSRDDDSTQTYTVHIRVGNELHDMSGGRFVFSFLLQRAKTLALLAGIGNRHSRVVPRRCVVGRRS